MRMPTPSTLVLWFYTGVFTGAVVVEVGNHHWQALAWTVVLFLVVTYREVGSRQLWLNGWTTGRVTMLQSMIAAGNAGRTMADWLRDEASAYGYTISIPEEDD